MFKAKLTEDQIDEIAELREKGMTIRALADKFEVSAGCIDHQCRRLCAIPPQGLGRSHKAYCPKARGQGMTTDEVDKLKELQTEGLGAQQIARALSQPVTKIRYRLFRIAMLEEQEYLRTQGLLKEG